MLRLPEMALTKKQKSVILDRYAEQLRGASAVVLVKQKKVTVNTSNDMRKALVSTGTTMMIAKKRLLIKAAAIAGFESTELPTLDGGLIALIMHDDQLGSLKVIQGLLKKFKKTGSASSYEYVGGWYDKQRKDSNYVSTLATLPSKEELIGKLLFLFKYPVQSFVSVLDKIAEKKNQ